MSVGTDWDPQINMQLWLNTTTQKQRHTNSQKWNWQKEKTSKQTKKVQKKAFSSVRTKLWKKEQKGSTGWDIYIWIHVDISKPTPTPLRRNLETSNWSKMSMLNKYLDTHHYLNEIKHIPSQQHLHLGLTADPVSVMMSSACDPEFTCVQMWCVLM